MKISLLQQETRCRFYFSKLPTNANFNCHWKRYGTSRVTWKKTSEQINGVIKSRSCWSKSSLPRTTGRWTTTCFVRALKQTTNLVWRTYWQPLMRNNDTVVNLCLIWTGKLGTTLGLVTHDRIASKNIVRILKGGKLFLMNLQSVSWKKIKRQTKYTRGWIHLLWKDEAELKKGWIVG